MEQKWRNAQESVPALYDCRGPCRRIVTVALQLHGLFMTAMVDDTDDSAVLQCSNTAMRAIIVVAGVVGAEGFEPPTLSV
jgi:hypothetical protein